MFDEYQNQMVIERIKENIKETLRKQHIPEDIIKEVPMLTAGYADAVRTSLMQIVWWMG
jgi:hypothetical protein